MRFFKKEDRFHTLRIDQSLQLYRINSHTNNFQDVIFEGSVMLSTSNTGDGCSTCAPLAQRLFNNNPSTKKLPSLEEVMYDTAFATLEM